MTDEPEVPSAPQPERVLITGRPRGNAAMLAAMAALVSTDGPRRGTQTLAIKPTSAWRPKPVRDLPSAVIINRDVAAQAKAAGGVIIVQTKDSTEYHYSSDGVLRRAVPKIRSKKERRRLKARHEARIRATQAIRAAALTELIGTTNPQQQRVILRATAKRLERV